MGWRHWIDNTISSRKGLASFSVGLAVAVAGLATILPATAQLTGIAATKHNLGTAGTGNNKLSAGTAEICVFCHTPHGADTSAAVPLWNRTLGLVAPSTYQTYDSLGTSSLDGRVAPVGSVSIACLSCHDGTQAMSTVINAPGSGFAFSTAPVWTGTNQDGTGKLIGVANLGTDLRNDHPIGIQYGGGGVTTTALAGPTRDADFKVPSNALVGNTRVWWVDTEASANGTRQKTDMALYTRTTTDGYSGQTLPEPFVECASCHDPHASANPTFLRISNDSSKVCLACHIK